MDEQAKVISSLNLCDYIGAAPYDMLWLLVSFICENIGVKFSKEQLRKKLGGCHWKYVVEKHKQLSISLVLFAIVINKQSRMLPRCSNMVEPSLAPWTH